MKAQERRVMLHLMLLWESIEYKFEHDMNIWQLDRYEIMKHL